MRSHCITLLSFSARFECRGFVAAALGEPALRVEARHPYLVRSSASVFTPFLNSTYISRRAKEVSISSSSAAQLHRKIIYDWLYSTQPPVDASTSCLSPSRDLIYRRNFLSELESAQYHAGSHLMLVLCIATSIFLKDQLKESLICVWLRAETSKAVNAGLGGLEWHCSNMPPTVLVLRWRCSHPSKRNRKFPEASGSRLHDSGLQMLWLQISKQMLALLHMIV